MLAATRSLKQSTVTDTQRYARVHACASPLLVECVNSVCVAEHGTAADSVLRDAVRICAAHMSVPGYMRQFQRWLLTVTVRKAVHEHRGSKNALDSTAS
jgi:hypothetical protein